MKPETFYIIDTSKIVFENFEDETILINLASGTYYGIMKVGKDIIKLLESGISNHLVLSVIAESYHVEQGEIEDDIHSFLSLLEEEGIIMSTESNTIQVPLIVGDLKYIKPILEKYSDMQDLILLDPVHDVNTKGWPNKKESNNDQAKN